MDQDMVGSKHGSNRLNIPGNIPQKTSKQTKKHLLYTFKSSFANVSWGENHTALVRPQRSIQGLVVSLTDSPAFLLKCWNAENADGLHHLTPWRLDQHSVWHIHQNPLQTAKCPKVSHSPAADITSPQSFKPPLAPNSTKNMVQNSPHHIQSPPQPSYL